MHQAHLWSAMESCNNVGMRRRHTAEERERLIAEVRSSGNTPRVVAERMGVCVSSAYRWMKEVAGAASSAPSAQVFARVVRERVSSLRLEVGGAVLIVESGFDPELLRQVVATLSGPA